MLYIKPIYTLHLMLKHQNMPSEIGIAVPTYSLLFSIVLKESEPKNYMGGQIGRKGRNTGVRFHRSYTCVSTCRVPKMISS